MSRIREWASRAVRAPAGWPLRVKLVVAVVLLAGIGLAATGTAAVGALRTYLYGKLGDQLQATTQSAVDALQQGPFHKPGGSLQLPSDYFIRVTDASGLRYVDLSSPTRENRYPPRLPRLNADHAAELAGDPFTTGSTHGSNRWRVLVTPLNGGSETVVVAVSMAEIDGTIARLVAIVAVVGGAVLVLVGVLGYLLVRTSLRPLETVEATAAGIAAGDLSRRVPELDSRTEMGRLSTALNVMLAQVEGAFRAREGSEASARASEGRMRQFLADAGHELRTPLTSIRGFSELYRQGAVNEPAAVGRLMGRIEGESVRMGGLVDDMMLLARLDHERPMERERVDLLQLARDAVGDAGVVAPDRQVRLDAELGSSHLGGRGGGYLGGDSGGGGGYLGGDSGGGGGYVVVGDASRLRQVLANLVNNALTHTPRGTPVTVRLAELPYGPVQLEVADEGPGLEPEDAARVFERFYRVDASRSRAAGGTGLGLSIVAAIVQGHGGQVSLDTRPGEGATFRVVLPRAGA